MSSPRAPAVTAETTGDDAWLKPAWFAAFLGILTLATYPHVFLGFQTFIYRDFGYFGYPIAHYFRESFWHGEVPLWNPLSNCGEPFLAEWNTQVLYPPALFYLIFPLSWSLGVFCLLHLFLGGLGMFFLARRWTHSPWAAAFAGLVFAFSGLALNSLIWPSVIPALGWMPWVVWLTERAWREGGRTLVAAALAGALQMLSGGVEVILLTWLVLGMLALAELSSGGSPRRRTVLRAVLVLLLVSGLCAAQLLPFFDLLRHSDRGGDFNGTPWPMPASGWANFLVPLFRCQPPHQGVVMQINQYWTASYYVGVATVALAGWAVWRVRQRRVCSLAALALICLVLALGDATPVYGWFRRHVSFIALMRFPIKFVILPVFVLPLLAAWGLAERQRAGRDRTVPSSRQWWLIWLATLVPLLVILAWARWFPHPNEDPSAAVANGAARAVFFTAIIGGLAVLERMSEWKVHRLLQLAVLLLVWQDLCRHTPATPTVSRAVFEPNLPRSLPVPRLGVSRALTPPAARTRLVATFFPDVTEDYVSRRVALFCNCNLLDGIPKCDGFFPLYLREQALLYVEPAEPMLDFLGVSQIAAETNLFGWTPRDTFMPLLSGGQKPVFANDSNTVRSITGTNFNPRREVYLPESARDSISANNTTGVRISSAAYFAHRIEARVESDRPAMLVAAQTYYHPWQAYVDDRPARLWRANYAFQALEVPGGAHRVKLVYEDRSFHVGVIISAATLAGCLIFVFRRKRGVG